MITMASLGVNCRGLEVVTWRCRYRLVADVGS